tara:strand:- start:336 stop:2087 length:1752 start_codon:yes stop_codon:yes gene_type:complete
MTLTQISSRGVEDTLRWSLGASGTDHYTFTGPGLTGTVNDPTIYLTRGQTYIFENNNSNNAHPFQIQSTSGQGGTAYNTGVTNNGGGGGTEIKIIVPHDSPDILYYQCTAHANMGGQFNVAGSVADGSISTTKLAGSAVTTVKLADDSVSQAKLINGAVSTIKIADDAVTADKLANSINTAIAANTAKDLTALSAANLTSGTIPDARLPATLPAISGANLTNLPASGKATNLVINGAMNVAQRGTSSTSNGYQTVDRFQINFDSGLTEAPTQEQVALSSSDTPYASGFRYAFKITNGNQTSQDANDYLNLTQKIEAQNIAQSGWNYTSTSGKITLSFWIKASIAQTMYVRLEDPDASKIYSFAVAVTTSWQKITKTISGNSSLVFNNDNGSGLHIRLIPYYGTSYTASGVNLDEWIADNGSAQIPDMANTWFSGNDATLEYTGVQLEVGDSASDFAHESYADTLAKCQRYYYVHCSDNYESIGIGMQYYSGNIFITHEFPTTMRVEPTMEALSGTSGAYVYERLHNNAALYTHTITHNTSKTGHNQAQVIMGGDASRAGQAVRCSVHWFASNAHKFLAYDAEL